MTSIVLFFVGIAEVVGVSDKGDGTYRLDFADGTSRAATPAEILAATKLARIEVDRAECRRRIFAVWPSEKQLSLGLGDVDGADDLADCRVWVKGNRDASNAARDLITAAATVEAVDAVTVAWPTYTGG